MVSVWISSDHPYAVAGGVMIQIKVTGANEISRKLAEYPKQASRALEMAIDQTVKEMRDKVKDVMPRVFDRPVPYTLNSVKVQLSKGHNMTASMYIATDKRMDQSYLYPQVEGGPRKLKGFERAADGKEYMLGAGAKRTQAGNITVPQAKSVVSGARKRGGDYVTITKPHGRLMPGVYQRFKTTKGLNKQANRASTRLLQRGRSRGRFVSGVVARGLKPILVLKRHQGTRVRPLLMFYTLAREVFDRRFAKTFHANLERLTK